MRVKHGQVQPHGNDTPLRLHFTADEQKQLLSLRNLWEKNLYTRETFLRICNKTPPSRINQMSDVQSDAERNHYKPADATAASPFNQYDYTADEQKQLLPNNDKHLYTRKTFLPICSRRPLSSINQINMRRAK